ncbi:Mitochondrial-processing peptidase subunit alpha [Apophysomyces ossiformis]|uniref:Mitochondrial-processing peptidase subunit alpha n=1 Tax=Apophysomyces ossiformis TaxID=679940 RepID=A0A8H7BXH3_9FUNG|nr:Mitochondrial-processing peptidase subunit alpha [Apophysomyces ossiformis]
MSIRLLQTSRRNAITSALKPHWNSVFSRSESSTGYAKPLDKCSKTEQEAEALCKVTTLPNGIRVASENTPGHFSSIGVYVDAGSRYETNRTRGVSHILDRLAFKSTANRTADQVVAEVESLGGNIMCSSTRESMMYQAAIFSQDLDRAISLFSEVVCQPIIDELEVEEQRQTAMYEIDDIWSRPESILPEILHTVAFKGNTLGNPLLCPADSLQSMTPAVVQQYRKTWYRPERMVIAACGARHDEVLDLAYKYFGHVPKSEENLDSVMTHQEAMRRLHKPIEKPSLLRSMFSAKKEPTAYELATEPAKYVGGIQRVHTGADALLNHVYIAFEGLPISDPDIYALATLQILLGGGGSFSAGGPGKGMYSRLFTNVLNQHYWVESCQAFNHCYTDSGLFGISGSCPPKYTPALVEVICRELDLVSSADIDRFSVQESELSRAKNQLKGSLLMNLESRMVQLEDLGRQIQVHGKKTGIDEMIASIDRISMKELRRVAARVLRGAVSISSGGSGKASIVVHGDLSHANRIEETVEKYGLGSG